MSHEKRNEPFHWKNKLDELDQLPSEEVLDKISSWERLHVRLSQKEKNKKVFRYWIAAACFLIAIGISWFFTNKKPGEEVTDKKLYPAQRSIVKRAIVKNELAKVDTQRITTVKKEIRKPGILFSNRENKAPKVLVRIEKNDSPNLAQVKDSLQDMIANTVNSADTIHSSLITGTTSRKKLRVVHINDLEKSMEPGVQYARSTSPFARINNFRDEDTRAFSLSKNASDNIVKIKLSPSN